MDIARYMQSITSACDALQDRVRHMISGQHWATDGAWKESVLRALISRTLPLSFSVASAFVVTESGPIDTDRRACVRQHDTCLIPRRRLGVCDA
jgi:hypothetical protein